MIARIWHGAVPLPKADEYLTLMREVAIPDYKSTNGNKGAWCLRRDEGGIVHFDMLTFWDDLESIKRFAGEDYETAKYYEFDDDYLIEKEPSVRHHQLFGE